jgi:AcrR family transcriptional regulator
MGRPSLSEREPYDTDRLTDVALRLFGERGYDATSMADIAAAAGLQKSSLYHHVGGKEELLERGVNRTLDALFEALEEPPAVAGPAFHRLRYVLRRAIEIEGEFLPETMLLIRLRGNTELERSVLQRRRAFDHALGELVAEAQREGGIRPDIDPLVASRLLMGMLGSLTEWFQRDGRLTWSDMADTILAVAFEGLTAAGARQPAP